MFHSLTNKISKTRNIMDNEFDTFEIKYTNPTDLFDDCKWNDLENFKKDDTRVGKVIYCLNNFPHSIHEIMRQVMNHNGYTNMSNTFYTINIFKVDNSYTYNFDDFYEDHENFITDLINENVRFIMIRVNEKSSIMGHVTAIIIDKLKKYILFFDTKNDIKYDIRQFMFVIDIINNATCTDYEVLMPYDVGYNNKTRLQGINFYCQTYILYVYLAILCNQSVHYKDFKNLFTNLITTQNMTYLLYYLYEAIEKNNSLINVNYNFPCISNTFMNIFNSVTFIIRCNVNKLRNIYNETKFEMIELSDLQYSIQYYDDNNNDEEI